MLLFAEEGSGEFWWMVVGLAGVGGDFVSAFTQVDQDNVTAIFFRRVGK